MCGTQNAIDGERCKTQPQEAQPVFQKDENMRTCTYLANEDD